MTYHPSGVLPETTISYVSLVASTSLFQRDCDNSRYRLNKDPHLFDFYQRGTNLYSRPITGFKPMPKVKFSKENQEVNVPEGTTIREAAKLLSINTNQGVNGIGATLNKYINCHGLGQCGTCRVFVPDGHIENTNTQTIWERTQS